MSSVYKKNSAPSPRVLRILRESPPAGFPAEFAEGAEKTQIFFASQVKYPRFTKKLRAFSARFANSAGIPSRWISRRIRRGRGRNANFFCKASEMSSVYKKKLRAFSAPSANSAGIPSREICGNYIPGQNGILDLPLRAFPVLKWRRSYVKDSMTNCRSALVCWSSI
jgi:hypothetical protein